MSEHPYSSDRPSTGPGSPSAGGARSALDWARDVGAADRLVADLDHFLQRRRRRRAQLATGAAAVLLAAGLVWTPWRTAEPLAPAGAAAVAVVHRPATESLPDGTVVERGPGAVVTVDFSAPARRVELRGGVAHFQVARDPARPFIVVAGGLEVRAVGTAFAVDPSPSAMAVLVTEGRVAVTRTASDGRPPAALSPTGELATIGAGEGIRVGGTQGAGPAVRPLVAAEKAQLAAWRVPRLEFSATPLAQAVAMFNTHGAIRLVLAEPDLSALQVSGVLRADDPDSLLRLLEGEFGLVADKRPDTWALRRK